MKIRTYKIIKGWNIHGDSEAIPNSKRKICHVVIGETDKDYIIEDMYEDIVQSICSSPNAYNISVKIGRDPQIIVLRDGKIVLHNPTTREHISYVREKLKDIPLKTLMNAYGEMRFNDEFPKKLSDSTMAVVAMINEDKNTFYTASFVYSVLREYVKETIFDMGDNEYAEEIQTLDYTELLELSTSIMGFKATKDTTHPLLIEVIQAEQDMETFENLVQTEIVSRFITGSITARKG